MRRIHPEGFAPTALVALMALALGGCAQVMPDLKAVYPSADRADRRPVIIIPGAFGSRLKNSATGEVVWGRFGNLLTSRFKLALKPSLSQHADLLDLPIDSTDVTANRDSLVAYDLFDALAGRGFYRRIVSTLRDVAGYHFGDINDPQPEEDCFAFYYDWRRDVVENAADLGKAIQRVRDMHQLADGRRQKVDLIAHSLGGLVARYYLKYGGRDVLDGEPRAPSYEGAQDVETLVLIGVPNEGTITTLTSHNDGIRIVRPLPPEAIFTMPATYETLPRQRMGPFIGRDGTPIDIDLYDASNWEKYGWSVFHPDRLTKLRGALRDEFGRHEGDARYELRLSQMRTYLAAALLRASRLNQALDRDSGGPDPVRYFAFGGDCTPTPARAMIIDEQGRRHLTITRAKDLPRELRTPAIERLMTEPGDGSVTRSSLLALNSGHDGSSGLRLDYSLFLCDTHRRLTENVTFQDNLLQFLLYRQGSN